MSKPEDFAGPLVLTNPSQIMLYHMLAQKHALRMEIKGIRFKQGSVSAMIKRQYGIKARSKADVLAAFEALIDERFTSPK